MGLPIRLAHRPLALVAMSVALAAAPRLAAQPSPEVLAGARQVDVYRVPGRFGGWPANHGIWSWGNEILVGFSAGYFCDNGPDRHAIDHDRPEEHLLARSLDGGESWRIENPAARGVLVPQGAALHGVRPPGLVEAEWRECPGGIDFTHPDFALTLRMTDANQGPSRFYVSLDRGHAWQGPFTLPLFDQQGIAARTDYVVLDRDRCLVFLTATKPNGKEGRPFCAATVDGGRTWEFRGWIGPEPAGYAIMPATVRLGDGALVSIVRVREGKPSWLAAYRSTDEGRTWAALSRVADTGEGNPASLHQLPDGRLCVTYGHRAPPYGIFARLSSDAGKSWGPPLLLRQGGGRDLGYPRSALRPDGQVVTIYYLCDDPGADRYIGATIWQPPAP